MYSMRESRPLGMQIHAVPDSEKFIDSTGRKLPWGYDYAPGAAQGEHESQNQQESGPFGRNSRRSRSNLSRSRSKTAEPRREEDRHRAENLAAEDAVFGSLRKAINKDEPRREGINEADAAARGLLEAELEPTEILLYGFGEDLQWAAIDFYERVSNGAILEDYDRQPPGQRYNVPMSIGRTGAPASLSKAAMRKRNKYAGGQHWIKVTFDSRQAAELAIASGPHIIKGYLVYAEPYQNRGPPRDEPVLATQAGVQVTSDVLPPSFSTNNVELSPEGTSSTVTSATATATATSAPQGSIAARSRFGGDGQSGSRAPLFQINANRAGQTQPQQLFAPPTSTSSAIQPNGAVAPTLATIRRSRIEGTTRAVVLPADMALAPKHPKASWSSWIGASEIIGPAVPRKDDGAFDWQKASMYWRIFFWIDMIFGTDFCGLKADD